jgi:uncharacterized protein YjbI with pentapeptide repeats
LKQADVNRLVTSLDGIFISSIERFDLLAAVAKLDPAEDFVGLDLRGADFAGSNLSAFNFSLCDLRNTNIADATAPPSGLETALTDDLGSRFSESAVDGLRTFFARYSSATLAFKRLLILVEASQHFDTEQIRFSAQAIEKLNLTGIENRVARRLLSLLESASNVSATLATQTICDEMIAGAYPFRHQSTAAALVLAMHIPAVRSYLAAYLKRTRGGLAAGIIREAFEAEKH